MADKNWMLNVKAIKAAKRCISLIEKELEIRLTLSHPDFLGLIVEYAELTDSAELQAALAELAEFAPADLKKDIKAAPVVPIRAPKEPVEAQSSADSNKDHDDEVVRYKGKDYPKYKENKEFKGLYRGQPRYT